MADTLPFQASDEARKCVLGYVEKGPKGKWSWEEMVKDLFTICGLKEKVDDREKEIADATGKVLRSMYPTREKSWNAAWVDADKDTQLRQCDHIVAFVHHQTNFMLERVPKPPKPEPKPKKEEKGEGGAPPPPPAGGSAPAPPPPAQGEGKTEDKQDAKPAEPAQASGGTAPPPPPPAS